MNKEQWQLMFAAVIKTRQQYVDGVQLGRCPLCAFSKTVTNKDDCGACPHIIFNRINCHDWVQKNSSFLKYINIFYSSHSAVIKRKCIARLNEWIKLINKKIEEAE